MNKKYVMVCSACGSDNVFADAWAEWDVANQEWELVTTFGKGSWCNDCDGECTIDKKKAVV